MTAKGKPVSAQRRPIGDPTPDEIRASREAAGLTQAEAAELVHYAHKIRWSELERGERNIDLSRWELWLIKTGQHEGYRKR